MRVWPVLLILLAGCVGSGTDPGPSATPDAPDATVPEDLLPPEPEPAWERIDWWLSDCFFAYATVRADADLVAGRLPLGFALSTQGVRVDVSFEANICDEGSALNGSESPQSYASVWVGVIPPSHLMTEEGLFHVVAFDVLVEDDERRNWMQDRGIPAHDGGVNVEHLPGGGFVMDFDLDDEGLFTIRVPAGTAVADEGGTFDQWLPGDQLSYWRTDWQSTSQSTGTGTLEIDPGSSYRAWFQQDIVQATVNFGRWDYTDGDIYYPAPRAAR